MRSVATGLAAGYGAACTGQSQLRRVAVSSVARSQRGKEGLAATMIPPLSPAPELEAITKMLERDPKLLLAVMGKLDSEQRRRLIVAGGAMEWFGKENVAAEVEKADADEDRLISPKDFDNWFINALKRRSGGQSHQQLRTTPPTCTESGARESQSVGSSSTLQPSGEAGSDAVPYSSLLLVVAGAALPFVGFGFLDNAIMILAGGAIDSTLGFYLNCSVMASAAMGNVVSGALGMQVHGLIDKAIQKLNVGAPVLTEAQRTSRRVFLAGHIGGTLGIIVGLSLGMLPLLWIPSEETKADYALFHSWDRNGNGFIEEKEVFEGLMELGLPQSAELAHQIVQNYGTDHKISVTQFVHLRNDMRWGKAVLGSSHVAGAG